MPWTTTTTRSSGFVVTAAVWNAELVENMKFLQEVAYAQITSDKTVTATTSATSELVIATSAISYENVPHYLEFSAAAVQPSNTGTSPSMHIGLYDNGAANGVAKLARMQSSGTVYALMPCDAPFRFTPSAATHTYQIRAYVTGGTGTVFAGAGGNDVMCPAFVRITRVPT